VTVGIFTLHVQFLETKGWTTLPNNRKSQASASSLLVDERIENRKDQEVEANPKSRLDVNLTLTISFTISQELLSWFASCLDFLLV
jgi:hypothetical protein